MGWQMKQQNEASVNTRKRRKKKRKETKIISWNETHSHWKRFASNWGIAGIQVETDEMTKQNLCAHESAAEYTKW